MLSSLRERIQSYQDIYDTKFIPKLPVVVVLNGRSFKKATSLLRKPFDQSFVDIMSNVMIKLASEIDGSIFVYSFNDEIVLVSRNDQTLETEAWFDNRVQKIVSASASIATLEFNHNALSKDVQILGDATFTAQSFVVPNVAEAMNVLVHKQQQAVYSALSLAAFHELHKRYEADVVRGTLANKSAQDKVEILAEKCGIDFDAYATHFVRGSAVYRAIRVVNDELRNKLTIDMELPLFAKDQAFLSNIFRGGRDILRAS